MSMLVNVSEQYKCLPCQPSWFYLAYDELNK